MPPNVDAIANVDSFRFYPFPDGFLYLHLAYRDTNAIPEPNDLHIARASSTTCEPRARLSPLL